MGVNQHKTPGPPPNADCPRSMGVGAAVPAKPLGQLRSRPEATVPALETSPPRTRGPLLLAEPTQPAPSRLTHREADAGVEVRAADVGDRRDELVVDFHAAEEGAVVLGVTLYVSGLWDRGHSGEGQQEAHSERQTAHTWQPHRPATCGFSDRRPSLRAQIHRAGDSQEGPEDSHEPLIYRHVHRLTSRIGRRGLIWERVVAAVIKDLKRRSSWITK